MKVYFGLKVLIKKFDYVQMFCKTLIFDKKKVGIIKILEILENKKRGGSRAAILDLIAENLDPESFPNQAYHITRSVFSLINDKEKFYSRLLDKNIKQHIKEHGRRSVKENIKIS